MELKQPASIMIGKTITKIEIAEDNKAVRFMIEGGEPVVAKCDGDCCSYTWIESIETPSSFPAKVSGAVELELPDRDDSGEEEVIAFYGLKLTTNKGDIVIDYRNSSNGYYGGNLSWPGEYHDGGVFGQNDSNEIWQEVSPISFKP